MNDVKRRFFSGDTLQQALVQAANYFNLDPSYVAYRSLEKRHGFLKTRRKVVIEVDPDSPRRETPVPVPQAGRAVPPPPPSAYLIRPAEPEDSEGPEPGNSIAPEPVLPAVDPPAPRAAASPSAPGRAEGRPPRERPEGNRGNRGGDRGGRDRDRPRPPRDRGDRGDRPRSPRAVSPSLEGMEPFRSSDGEAAGAGGLVTLPEKPRGISERYPAASGPAAEAAAKGAALLMRLAGLDLAPRVFQGEERLEVDLSGEDVDWCFADEGELLMAVEHLLPRMIRTLSGEAMAIRVDCDNFHEIREERLRSLAQRVAEEVRKGGKPRVLEPMNPADRRIIHTTLADDPNVVTESDGEGYFKRIMVKPAAPA
ncbi:MAG: spoIIIJ-associated protein [Solirubrobacteraceae bacterium]|jgi:predicted RNA-binding protein Jag|nr:spoIIIJ-associated protein [Solirubrobacteraceae bacterium]